MEEPLKKHFHHPVSMMVVIILKGLAGAVEICIGLSLLLIAGIGSYMSAHIDIANLIIQITAKELLEDPNDWLANWLLNQDPTFLIKAGLYTGLILLMLGMVKLSIAIGIWYRSWTIRNAAMVILIISNLGMLYELAMDYSVIKTIALIIDLLILLYVWMILPRHLRIPDHTPKTK